MEHLYVVTLQHARTRAQLPWRQTRGRLEQPRGRVALGLDAPLALSRHELIREIDKNAWSAQRRAVVWLRPATVHWPAIDSWSYFMAMIFRSARLIGFCSPFSPAQLQVVFGRPMPTANEASLDASISRRTPDASRPWILLPPIQLSSGVLECGDRQAISHDTLFW